MTGRERHRVGVGERESSPLRLIVALLVAMVTTEGLVFLVHVLLPPLPLGAELAIDLTLHVGILFPSLYTFVLSPLLHLITERSLAETALRESEERHRAIVAAFDGFIYTVTADYRVGFMNDNLIRRTGHDATGEHCFRVLQGLEAACPWCVNDRVFAGERVRWEFESPRDHRWYYSVDTPFPLVDGGVGKLAMILDVSDRKRAEHELEASLREKDLLLREVHHRVKNNLQIISALLELQAQYAADKRHVRLFADSRDRIATLALIYEVMSEAADLTRIDPDAYIRQLLVHLCASHAVDTATVSFEVTTSGITFDIDHAIPCALIMHELVSNALRHAFPEGRRGFLRIGLGRVGADRVLLRVADDGVGFPIEQEQANGLLGMRLVGILVRQLEGTMAVVHGQGTEFRIEFGVTSLRGTD